MKIKHLEVRSMDSKRIFYLKEYDSDNNILGYVAMKNDEIYSIGDLNYESLKILMKSDGDLIDLGLRCDEEKAIVMGAHKKVKFYFYLSNNKFFSIDLYLSDFRDKLELAMSSK